MSEAVRPVESMTLKRPLNITRLQHWGQLSCQSQKIGKKKTTCTHTRSHSYTFTQPVCLLTLSTAFCSLFSWDAKCRWDESAACAQSQEKLPVKSKHLYEYQNTQGTVEDERKRRRGEGHREDEGESGSSRTSSKVARKASVPLSFCIFDWTKSHIHMNTSFLPLYFPSGYLFWKAAMHNKGSVLCLLVGWGANTPQLIMCLSVAVWAAAKGIRSSICECCSPHSRMPHHASQISSFFKKEREKKHFK